MIGSLRGKLIEKRPNQILIDVAGVGYQVQIPLSTFAAIGALHSDATLLIHTHVREDQITLYGFVTTREKHCFELLISASGVGPSLALKILSGISIEELVPAIRKSDFAQLVRIPGVGRKTAERIVLELRDKLAAIDVAERLDSSEVKTGSEIEAQVKSVLINLGYEPRTVDTTLEQLRGKEVSALDDLLNSALQQLGRRAMQKKARAARQV